MSLFLDVPHHIPLALYIHMPWCVKKCPYCDFNSHAVPQGNFSVDGTLLLSLEQAYLAALVADAAQQVELAAGRPLSSVFIGGGTPSLISASGYQWLFEQLRSLFTFMEDCEITLEANPGTLEHAPFAEYLHAGINRLSLGVQTFDNALLQTLGRVHGSDEARHAIQRARLDGFSRLNVDLMHGLPDQTVAQAVFDLQSAIDCGANHISWYQLTIEPNTVFFRTQPLLPVEDRLLRAEGFVQYEVSAWTKERPSQHNLNYWQFGDYLAIGAGAHGKVTVLHEQNQHDIAPLEIKRFQKSRLPKDYLAEVPALILQYESVTPTDLPFEFMMNALRLVDGVPIAYFAERTGLLFKVVHETVQELQREKLLDDRSDQLRCTPLGFNYLNEVLARFS